jgi:ABC-type branched-subunit amino acid transport system ATPase component
MAISGCWRSPWGWALKPRLLILDEPTQGLSDSEIEAFIKLIRELRKATTILLIEHNMQVVMRLADRITVLDAGKVLAEGSPALNPQQQGGAGRLSRRSGSGGRAWLTR